MSERLTGTVGILALTNSSAMVIKLINDEAVLVQYDGGDQVSEITEHEITYITDEDDETNPCFVGPDGNTYKLGEFMKYTID